MKIVDKIRNKMGQNPESEEYIEEVDNTDDSDLQATTYQNPDNVVDFKNKAKNNQLKVMVIEPVSFDDAQQVADHIPNHKPVVVNFENTSSDIAKRIIDFISGTTYALSGDIKKVGKNVFMCAPNNVSVNFTEELKKPSSSTTMPWEE